jgi:hypothetical protein
MAPRRSSTRSRPARSPARKSATATPICGTSRPTSRGPSRPSPSCGPSWRRRIRTLVAKIDSTGKALGDLLETYRDGDGFKLYTDLTEDDVKKLTQALDAFSENVAQVAGVVAKA